MASSEKTYVIPLRKGVMKTPRYKRAKKAISVIKEFVARHSSTSQIRLGKYLNMKVWEEGIKNAPASVKVNAVKDDKGTVTVELVGAPKDAPKSKAKKVSASAKPAEPAAAAQPSPAAAATTKSAPPAKQAVVELSGDVKKSKPETEPAATATATATASKTA